MLVKKGLTYWANNRMANPTIYTYNYSLNLQGLITLVILSALVSLLVIIGIRHLKVLLLSFGFIQKLDVSKYFYGFGKDSVETTGIRDVAIDFYSAKGKGLLSDLQNVRRARAAVINNEKYLDDQENRVVLKSKFFNIVIGVLFYTLSIIMASRVE